MKLSLSATTTVKIPCDIIEKFFSICKTPQISSRRRLFYVQIFFTSSRFTNIENMFIYSSSSSFSLFPSEQKRRREWIQSLTKRPRLASGRDSSDIRRRLTLSRVRMACQWKMAKEFQYTFPSQCLEDSRSIWQCQASTWVVKHVCLMIN